MGTADQSLPSNAVVRNLSNPGDPSSTVMSLMKVVVVVLWVFKRKYFGIPSGVLWGH